MKPGRPRSVERPSKSRQSQEEPQLDDLNEEEAREIEELHYEKIKKGAKWSGLVNLDLMRGRLVAPLPI